MSTNVTRADSEPSASRIIAMPGLVWATIAPSPAASPSFRKGTARARYSWSDAYTNALWRSAVPFEAIVEFIGGAIPPVALWHLVSRAGAKSSGHAPDRSRLSQRLAELGQRGGLDLAGSLGGQAQAGADLAERSRFRAEAVVAADHGALTVLQLTGEVEHPVDLEIVEHLLVCLLGDRVDDRFSHGRAGRIVRAQRVREPPRHAFGGKQALDLGGCKPRRAAQLSGCGFPAVALQKLVAHSPEVGELARRAVGERDGPG